MSVTDSGGTYEALVFPTTAATVTGVGGTIASFGSPLLSYAYYDVSTSTSLGSTAPTNAGNYTVTATFAGNSNYQAANSSAVAFTISAAPLTSAHVSVTDAGGIYRRRPSRPQRPR